MKKKHPIYESTVISWKQGKGYGFVANPNGGDDLFLHNNDLRGRPRHGDTVRFRLKPDQEGRPTIYDARLAGCAVLVEQRWPLILLISGLPFALSLWILPYNRFPLALYSCMSLACFFLVRRDKQRAEQGRWRIPNGSFYLAHLLWGWPGSLIAQKRYRHKAQQKPFQGALHFSLFVHYVFWMDALLLDHLFVRLIILFLQNFVRL